MARESHSPAFLLYVDDFVSDGKVEAMTTEGVGAYILLLCKAWREDPPGSIPNDDRVLARWARLAPDRWAECREAVLAPFSLGTDGRLHQKRLRVEYQKWRESQKRRSEAATRNAHKRWDNANCMPPASDSHTSGNAAAMPGNAISYSISERNNNNKSGPSNDLIQETARFLERWNATPGTHKVPDSSAIPLMDSQMRLTDDAWLRMYPQALAMFPLKCLGGNLMDVWKFFEEGTVGKILCGRYTWTKDPPRDGKQKPKPSTMEELTNKKESHDTRRI